MHKYQFPIESDRLIYRHLEPQDKISWQAFFVNNPCLHFVGITEPKSPEEEADIWHDRQIKRYEETGVGILAAIEKETNRLIGNVGLIWRENVLGEQVYEIGYSVLPEEWRKGYATEMASALRMYFEQHKIAKKVISIIHVDNTGSQRVATHNGMTRGSQFDFHGSPCYQYYKKY